MADNVLITPGTGVAIATDEVTGTLEQVQLFKLAYSADGVRTLVPADLSGLLVQITGLLLAQGAASLDALGVLMQAIASDAAPGYPPDTVRPLSVTTDGRLRVVTADESFNMAPWSHPNEFGSDIDEITHPLCAW